MNKILIGIIGVVAVVGVVMGSVAIQKANTPAVTAGIFGEKGDKGDKGEKGDVGARGPAGVSVASKAPVTYGANPDLNTPYFSFGNVRRWASNVSLTQNASTTCALQSPAATSSLVAAGIRFQVASSSALLVEMGNSSSAFATTTLLGRFTVGAGAQATIIASTSPAAGDAIVFSPNTFFTVKIGQGATGSLPVGSCHATWEEYN